MGLRFFRRIHVPPGFTLNLSKRGVSSVSVGVRGAHYTVGLDGRQRGTVGLPGTGLFYTAEHMPTGSENRGEAVQASRRQPPLPSSEGYYPPGWKRPSPWFLPFCGLLTVAGFVLICAKMVWTGVLVALPAVLFGVWGTHQYYRRERQLVTGAEIPADLWEIIRGPMEYRARVVYRSANLPVIVLTHNGWQDCAVDLWRSLRASDRRRGRRSPTEAFLSQSVDLACIDVAQRSNAAVVKVTDEFRARLPLLTIMINGERHAEFSLSGCSGLDLPRAVTAVLNQAVEDFYGVAAVHWQSRA